MHQHPCVDFRTELSQQLGSLRSYSLSLCGNRTDAEDLIQDTMLRALRYEESFELGSNMRAWLSKIMYSIFVSRSRRANNERRAIRRLTNDPNAWTQPEQASHVVELSPPVQAALRRLKDPFRSVVHLVDLHQLSYSQAAERLQVPIGTVMSRLSRGRKQLATVLNAKPAVARALNLPDEAPAAA